MEMVLAVTILSVLILLAFTASGRVRTQSEAAACLNKMRQIGVAQNAWSNDNDGFFIPNRDDRNGRIVFWTQALLPYLGYPPAKWPETPPADIFWCPSAKGPLPSDPLGYDGSHGVARSSYAQNIALGGWEPGHSPRYRRVAVQKPSKMVLLTEGRFLSAASWSVDEPGSGHGALYRHSAKLHLLFVDGHVETSAYPISPARGNARYNWDIGAELR